jgi:hypothetical protein
MLVELVAPPDAGPLSSIGEFISRNPIRRNRSSPSSGLTGSDSCFQVIATLKLIQNSRKPSLPDGEDWFNEHMQEYPGWWFKIMTATC